MTTTSAAPRASAPGGVQSVQRALDILEVMERHGGHMAIGEIGDEIDLPLPTTHRLLRTLVERGYVRQLSNRRYALGFRLLSLGVVANGLVGIDVRHTLADLVSELGETANFAVLVGDRAEYVAQVESPHAMRMFTEVGRRVELHCTGVGKALLAQMDAGAVSSIVRRLGLTAKTSHTITSENALLAELDRIRAQGYAMDEQEQELGVRCIGVAIPGSFLSPMAISVSGPATRMTDALVDRAIPLILAGAQRLGSDIAETAGGPAIDSALGTALGSEN